MNEVIKVDNLSKSYGELMTTGLDARSRRDVWKILNLLTIQSTVLDIDSSIMTLSSNAFWIAFVCVVIIIITFMRKYKRIEVME